MTVADIKEYIQKRIEEYDEIPSEYQDAKFKQATADLVIVLGMLDELEQPIEIDTKKYFEQINKLVDKEMAQYLKDQMKKALKKEID